jgi:hypothetical protein
LSRRPLPFPASSLPRRSSASRCRAVSARNVNSRRMGLRGSRAAGRSSPEACGRSPGASLPSPRSARSPASDALPRTQSFRNTNRRQQESEQPDRPERCAADLAQQKRQSNAQVQGGDLCARVRLKRAQDPTHGFEVGVRSPAILANRFVGLGVFILADRQVPGGTKRRDQSDTQSSVPSLSRDRGTPIGAFPGWSSEMFTEKSNGTYACSA